MPERHHYLICYDISCNRNRYRACQSIRAYAVGRQKSAYLCWLTLHERQKLEQKLQTLLAPDDALLVVGLSSRYQTHYYGQAQPLEYPVFIVV